ncbi:MAG: DUF4921 family protein [Planctomycetes bacterium]|nr:DUF4921 family protein [Planctomycetota bacterium]MCB9884801.1 DUF4921 family protein [Planctomycetota bacterium]
MSGGGADDGAPRRLIEPTTGRPILMAPGRQARPMHTASGHGHAATKPCPFCPGEEAQTPPEVEAVREAGSRADAPGWIARAFANKYPACAVHEVIAEGAAHHEQPGDLDVATWRAVVGLWCRRIAAIEALPEVDNAYLFKNVGAAAGASIAHNHSQILGLSELPPRLVLERDRAAQLDHCPWCRVLQTAAGDDRLVFETAAHAVVIPDPPRLPNEIWLLPKRCDDDLLRTDLDSLAAALQHVFAALARGLDRPAFNIWLHRIPGAAFHWHFELQPRTGQMAGLELGGDMYINSVPPQVTMARLRRGQQPAAPPDTGTR